MPINNCHEDSYRKTTDIVCAVYNLVIKIGFAEFFTEQAISLGVRARSIQSILLGLAGTKYIKSHRKSLLNRSIAFHGHHVKGQYKAPSRAVSIFLDIYI